MMRVITFSAMLLLATVLPVSANIINVPADSATIQGGINGASEGDTVLVSNGTYYERINFYGKGITVASNYVYSSDTLDIQNTIIDADTSVIGVADTGSVVCFVNGEDSTSVLMGFTITNGMGTLSGGNRYGGGIYCRANPRIISCIVSDNNSSYGGGIYITGHISIINCHFIDNYASNEGSGFYCNETYVEIINASIINNGIYINLGATYIRESALSNFIISGYDMIIDISNTLMNDINFEVDAYVILNEIVIFNSNIDVYDSGSRLDLSNSTLHNTNIIMRATGGIGSNSGFIDSSIVEGNIIFNGWSNDNNPFSINNSVIIGEIIATNVILYSLEINSSILLGGGINGDIKFLYIYNTTITGQGINVENIWNHLNKIILENVAIYTDAMSPIVCDATDSLFLSCSNFYTLDSTIPWLSGIPDSLDTANVYFENPRFCDIQNNDYTIEDVSICAPGNNACSTLIGVYGVGCDHRAERIYVDTTGSDSAGNGSMQYPYRTIQYAIGEAFDEDTIIVNPGVYYERINYDGKAIVVASNYIDDPDTLHIVNTVIDADSSVIGYSDTGSVVCFYSGEESTSKLVGFTIRNGTGTLSDGDYYGGGIFIDHSSPEIRKCYIEYNSAPARGGGIWGNVTQSFINGCRITNDSAGIGGGVAFSGNYKPELFDCIISDNDYLGIHYDYFEGPGADIDSCAVENNQGGGIACVSYGQGTNDILSSVIKGNLGYGISFSSYNPVMREDRQTHNVIDCVIENNSGRGVETGGSLETYLLDGCIIKGNQDGGVMGHYDDEIFINDCIIIDNNAAAGGGVYRPIDGSPLHITNCLFASNTADSGAAIYYGGPVEIFNSTFVENSADDYTITSFWGALDIGYSVIAYNYIGAALTTESEYSADIVCADIFGNEGGDWIGNIAGQLASNGNFSLDPQFCDTANGIYTLYHTSPCLAENNSCDSLIGLYGVGCYGIDEFHLLQPANNAFYIDPPVEFVWETVVDIDSGMTASYRFYIDDDSLFSSPDSSDILTDTSFILLDTLGRSVPQYWRIGAFNYAPQSFSEEVWSVRFNGNPPTPEPFAPLNGASADTLTIFSWLESVDPDSLDYVTYAIQMDDDSLFASPEIDQSGLSNIALDEAFAIRLGQLPGAESLQIDTRYYWRVRADDSYGFPSPWTDSLLYFTYMYQNHPPNSPDSGFAPSNDEEIISLTPTVTWIAATDPDPDDHPGTLAYDFFLFEDTSTGGQEYRDTTAQGINQVTVTDTLHDNAHFFYQVRTIDDEGLASTWSVLQSFWTNHYDFPPEPFPLYSPDPDHTQVVMYTHFAWGNTVDYDPMASFTYTFEISPDSQFQWFVTSFPDLSDTALTFVTDTLALAGEELFWRVLAIDDDSLTTTGGIPEETRYLRILPPGDANCDGQTNGLDVVYLVNFCKGGPPPCVILAGDANGNCATNGLDVTYLVNYLKGGSPPVRPDCEPALAIEDDQPDNQR